MNVRDDEEKKKKKKKFVRVSPPPPLTHYSDCDLHVHYFVVVVLHSTLPIMRLAASYYANEKKSI